MRKYYITYVLYIILVQGCLLSLHTEKNKYLILYVQMMHIGDMRIASLLTQRKAARKSSAAGPKIFVVARELQLTTISTDDI